MINKLLLVLTIVLLGGCITYDPPVGGITIYNNSNSAIYVYATDADSLPLSPQLELYEKWESSSDNLNNLTRNPNSPPYYFIDAHSYSFIRTGGTLKKPHLNFEDNIIRLFFINQSTMRTKKWSEICNYRLYIKKIWLTENQLFEMGWSYSYNP